MAKAKLDKKTSELLISVVADKKIWKKEQDNAFTEISKTKTIKGFRKGNVPADILKKHISSQEVFSGAITKMLDVLVKEASEAIDKDVMILDSPTYKVDKISDAELEVTFIYPVYPEVKIGDYKKLGVKYKEPKFDPKVVDEEIKRIQNIQGTLETKKGKIAKGDTAIFDFVGTVDGVAFDGGTAENHTLEIGSGQFIPGFEDQMIGLSAGDKKDVKVTFPKEYHSENLKGKDAVFAVTIKEVKVKKLPALDKDFVKSTGVKDVETFEEFKEYLTTIFKEQGVQKAKTEFQRAAFDKIVKEADIIVPAQLIAKEMQNQAKHFEEQMKQQGLTMQQYIDMTGMKPEALNAQFKIAAEGRLKESLVFAEISKAEKIEISEEEYEKEYVKLAKVYGQDEKSIKNVITKQQMQVPMINDRVIELLIKYNK